MGITDLDKAMAFLYKKHQYYETHETLKETAFKNSSDIDVEAIIVRLVKDGMLHHGISNSNKHQFKLTIDGMIKHETSGYPGEAKRKLTQARLQSWQTWAIVVGTVFAGLYGLWEIIKTVLSL